MYRREFITGTAAAIGATLVSHPAGAKVPLNTLSNYFNGITTLQAGFTQTNPNGSRQTGTLYMRRPGRARFEYQGDKTLIVVGGSQVAVFDGRSNRGRPEVYPLKKTPLWLILESRVDLARRNTIIGHSGDARTTTLVAQDPEARQQGKVELIFFNDPLTLAGWTTVDGQGARTRVQLERIRMGGNLSSSLFSIAEAKRSRGG